MTTIAWRNGVLAADSRTTIETEAGGARMFSCKKLFRKTVKLDGSAEPEEVILATAGESSPGMLFVDWFGSGKEISELRSDFLYGEADFTILVMRKSGLFEYDAWMRAEKVDLPFYAVGSGAKAALAAMDMGASAAKAVEIACRWDPYSALPVVTMKLKEPARAKKPRAAKPDSVVTQEPENGQ